MPEYSQIQTYIKYDKKTIYEQTEKLKVALGEIGFDKEYINEGLNNFEWKIEDNGFVYSLENYECKIVKWNDIELHCRPLLMGWTPNINENLKDSWLEISLLYYTDEITLDYKTGKFKNGVLEVILNHMKIISRYFDETGTYFTDEVTDSKPWEALVGIDDIIWAFDIGIVPEHLESFYEKKPSGFRKEILMDKFMLIRDGI